MERTKEKMKQIEEKILDFAEVHPVWGWILVRLAFIICFMAIIGFALLAFALFILPIIQLAKEQGFQMGWWFIVPAPILACWGCCAAVKWIYETFLEDW